LARRLSSRDIDVAIQGFGTFASIVKIAELVEGVATHPEDDLILATALSGQVDYLVTLDQQLLRLGSYGGVQIVSPQAFLTILTTET
jgi:predicted nucleic acid-binding protein